MQLPHYLLISNVFKKVYYSYGFKLAPILATRFLVLSELRI